MRTTDPKTPRTPAQQALIALREQLGGITQQELAFRMGKAVTTVARWETARPPSGESLRELLNFALDNGCHEPARMFGEALEAERGTTGPRNAEEMIACEGLLALLRNRDVRGMDEKLSQICDLIQEGRQLIEQRNARRQEAIGRMAKQEIEDGTYDDF